MLHRIKTALDQRFFNQPLSFRLILCLTASIFLPLFVTVPAIIFTGVFLFRHRIWLRNAVQTNHTALYGLLCIMVLTVPLAYSNYIGFACGVGLILMIIIAAYVRYMMTDKIFAMICNVCCVMSIISAVIALAEYLFRFQDRITAMTNNANYYAYLIELMILVCFYAYLTTRKKLPLFAIAANISVLFLTGCRSAWIALLFGLFAYCWIIRNKKYMNILSVITIVLVAAVYFYPSLVPRYSVLDDSLTDRFHIWSMAFTDFLKHPFFGRGLLAHYQLTGNKITPHAHNIYLDMLESTGIFGTSAIIFIFSFFARQLLQAYRQGDESVKARVALCGSAIAATMVHGITDAPIVGFQTGMMFALLLSMCPKPVYITEALHRAKSSFAVSIKS